jgi:hypothetical protein
VGTCGGLCCLLALWKLNTCGAPCCLLTAALSVDLPASLPIALTMCQLAAALTAASNGAPEWKHWSSAFPTAPTRSPSRPRQPPTLPACLSAAGHAPATAFLGGQLELDDAGYIITAPDSTATSIPGVYAAGDVQDRKWRQAITSAGSGALPWVAFGLHGGGEWGVGRMDVMLIDGCRWFAHVVGGCGCSAAPAVSGFLKLLSSQAATCLGCFASQHTALPAA